MTLLEPIGFISLISLLILLLIYILKPNFQQKMITSTYIWKLSLKYKKKKLPINKFRNILLIICQILIFCLLTTILIKPAKIIKTEEENEVILILDASASMRCDYEDETRFERAIDLLKDKLNETFDNNGTVSIVIASSNPYFLVERGTVDARWQIEKQVDDFKTAFECSYGANDLDEATTICQDILLENPAADIFIYTDLTVDYIPTGINVVDVTQDGEYNIAILDATAEIIDNYYSFTIELVSYGRDETIDLQLDVYGANATETIPDGVTYTFNESIDLNNDTVKKVIFVSSSVDISEYPEDDNTYYIQMSDTDKVFSYESIHISFDIDDCFYEDNSFDIYGGTKETIKVLYASSSANSFFNGIIFTLQNALQDRFDIQLTEVKKGDVPNEGYDLYIYEHTMMPTTAPVDGIVIYADPQANVANAGFSLSQIRDLNRVSLPLTEEMQHPLIDKVTADNITVSRYTEMSNYDAAYQVLMSCDGKPVLMLQDDENVKSIVMLFSLHYSNLAILKDFPIFMYNVFDYFIPSTIESNSFEVNDTVTINSRSSEISVTGYGETTVIDSFPNTLSVSLPGTYTVEQTTYFGKEITEMFYVKIPKSESNIFYEIETITSPVPQLTEDDYFEDLMYYFALALACLFFLEWILKGKDTN